MSVNGIELAVGQKWRTERRGEVEVVALAKDGWTGWDVRPTSSVATTFRVDSKGICQSVNAQHNGWNLTSLAEDVPGSISLRSPFAADGEKAGDLQPTAERPRALTEPAVSAPDILDAAAGHMRDRAATYDKPEGERSMAQTVAIFNLHHGTKLTPAQGWHFMQVLKDVRLFTNTANPHRDSVDDAVAYAALKGEALLQGGSHG